MALPFGGLGMGEIVLILVVLLLVFGARRLPELGGALGKGIREFKKSVRDIESELSAPADEFRDLKSSTRGSTAVPPAGGTGSAGTEGTRKAAGAPEERATDQG